MALSNTLPDPLNKRSYWGAHDGLGDQPGPGFANVKLTADQKVLVSRTNSQRIIARSVAGQKWKIDIGYHPMTREEFNPVFTFLLQQRGALTPFFVELPQHSTAAGLVSENLGDAFQTAGTALAGTTSMVIDKAGFVLKDSAGTAIASNDANTIPANIPVAGDVCTITDTNDTNHTKVYMVTYTETIHRNNGTAPGSDQTSLRIGVTPPFTRNISNNMVVSFKNVKFKVVLPRAVQSYSLGSDNLYKFKLQLEEYL